MKRGILYSVILMLLMAPVVVFLFAYANTASAKNAQLVSKIRGNELSSFSDSISQDVPRVMEIAAKRAIVSAITNVDTNGVPLNDAAGALEELVSNNSIDGTHVASMDGASIKDWSQTLAALGPQRGLNSSVNVTNVDIRPLDSFNLNFTVVIQVNITDAAQRINISRFYVTEKIISIEGFEDPLYLLNSQGFIRREFKQNQSAVYGTNEFDYATNNSHYFNDATGPSFLDRLENKFAAQAKYTSMTQSAIGLASIVNITEFAIRGLPVRVNQSSVDYVFFNLTNVTGYRVVNSPNKLVKLELGKNVTYGVGLDLNS